MKSIRLLLVFGALMQSRGLELSQRNGGRQGWKTKSSSEDDQPALNLGLILPHSIYNERLYNKAVSTTLFDLQKSKKKDWKFMDKFAFGDGQVHRIMMKLNPSPTEILDNLCQNFLKKNVTTILYLTNSELFGRSTASSQYFLQLASYLGIPVIAWNADNSGLERRRRNQKGSLHFSFSPCCCCFLRFNLGGWAFRK